MMRCVVLTILAMALFIPGHTVAGDAARPELPPLFANIERRTFDYFLETTNADNGLAPDRYPSNPFASIAATGFALTAYPVGVEHGWMTRTEAAQRTLMTLRFLHDLPMSDAASGTAGYKGFYYHFLDLQTGVRFSPWVELSSVDTGLLMMGVLFAQSYYSADTPQEQEIRSIADELYRRIEWTFMQRNRPLLSMGWHPESGFIADHWQGYNEAAFLYILALGSPTYPLEPEAWNAWTRSYDKDWGMFYGHEYLAFGPLFGHQYSHVWIDFNGIQDDYMRQKGIDYFINSRRATLAQREYAIANPMRWREYGKDIWGLTAGDGPQNIRQPYNGEEREFRAYSARGAGLSDHFDDGTIVPSAALSSLPFAPEAVIPAGLAMHRRYGDVLYGRYGFLDAFNPSFRYPVPLASGQVLEGRGWFASDHLGIDQGPILAGIANYRNGFIWNVMKHNPYIRQGLTRAGFRGGWLDAAPAQ